MIAITTSTEQLIPVVLPAGRIDSTTAGELNQALSPLIEQSDFLIIDLSKCDYLSSAGIRTLLVTEKSLKLKGGGLYLCSLLPAVFGVLEMAGLQKVLRIYKDTGSARAEIERIRVKTHHFREWSAGHFSFRFNPIDHSQKAAILWKDAGIAGINELGISVGTGSSAESPEEDPGMRGIFITTGNCAGFIPFDSDLSDEFRIPQNPCDQGIFVDRAISFTTEPAGVVQLSEPATITLGQLTESVYPLKKQLSSGPQDLISLVIANFSSGSPSVSVCQMIDRESGKILEISGFDQLPGLATSGEANLTLWGARFMLNELPPYSAGSTLSKFLEKSLTFENITGVEKIDHSDLTENPVAWVVISDGVADAAVKRIGVETADDCLFETHKAFLARRLYTDSSRLVISQLHGGYSAQTYQVTSYDHQGRKLRPTVLKIANRAIIARESERCQKFALPYILNNSAQVLGTQFFGDTGALRYNFVGIGGGQSQLKWLAHYFNHWTTHQLEPLFDKIFLQILHPWYGQPISETIYPFRDHDPTFTFFPRLCETAKEELSVSPDDKFFTVEETGQQLINPYWFLKYEFARLRETGIDYYTSICHGDLNMQNILLDEDMNVYLIDFSETKPRSLISDFARLEAIFMIEHAPLANEQEIGEYIRFISRFYDSVLPGMPPVNSYKGEHQDKVNRNVSLTLKMREYAFKGVNGHPNHVPYCMALLEWVLPVVCYYSAPLAVKRVSMIIAGHLCGKIAVS
jgi:anti-anti-sigma factor